MDESKRTDQAEARARRQEVVVRDVRMPFLSMVAFMVKWSLAAIPAMVILSTAALILYLVALSVIGGFGSLGSRSSGAYRPESYEPSRPTAPARSDRLDSLIRWTRSRKREGSDDRARERNAAGRAIIRALRCAARGARRQ